MLFFSDFSGDGPSEETRLKVAAMLVSFLFPAFNLMGFFQRCKNLGWINDGCAR